MGLLGYQYLWEIVLDCRDPEVTRESMEFLIKLHSSISSRWILTLGKAKIQEEFIRLCMVIIFIVYRKS